MESPREGGREGGREGPPPIDFGEVEDGEIEGGEIEKTGMGCASRSELRSHAAVYDRYKSDHIA